MKKLYGIPVSDETFNRNLPDKMQKATSPMIMWWAYLYIYDRLTALEKELLYKFPDSKYGCDEEGVPVSPNVGMLRYQIIEYRHVLSQMYQKMVDMPDFDDGMIYKPQWFEDTYLTDN